MVGTAQALCMDYTNEPLCYRNDSCIWDSGGSQCVGVSQWCPNRVTESECHRGGVCVFVQDTGECVARNQSIPLFGRCEAHHAGNVANGTSSGRPARAVVQLCVQDPLCDWDGYRERCVALRNYTCGGASAQNATECRSRVGCYWNTTSNACRAFAWDGETKCGSADFSNRTYCESLGVHQGSCLYDPVTHLCNPPLNSKPTHTSYGWRAYCAFSDATPISESANATECQLKDASGVCAVTWEPTAVDACAPSGHAMRWCATLQHEELCDLYSFCYFAAGDQAAQSPNPVISSPLGPYTSGCQPRNPEFGTDGWRDDWSPFVSDAYVVVSGIDSLFVRLEATVVVPQSTRDQGDPSQLRLWDVYIPHSNASTPNHRVSSLSGALGPVWGNVSDPLVYPTASVLRAALRTPSSSSPLSMNLSPLVYSFVGRQFESAHEFEGRNTMAIRVAASLPRADIERVNDTAATGYTALDWNVSVHSVNATSGVLDRVWLVRSVHVMLHTQTYQAHVVTLANVTNHTSTVYGDSHATPIAAVTVDPVAKSRVEWIELQRDTHPDQPAADSMNAVLLRDLSESGATPRDVSMTVMNPSSLSPSLRKEVEWVRVTISGAPYSNASKEVGFTNWLRRASVPALPVVDVFYAMDFDSRLLLTPHAVRVPWVQTEQTVGAGLQLFLQKQLAWELYITDPWWRSLETQSLQVASTANATVWLSAVNATGHMVAGPLAIDNTRDVATAAGATVVPNTYVAHPVPVTSNSSLGSYWWDQLNTPRREALGGSVEAVAVVSTSTYTVQGTRKLGITVNASALSYWLVPWFEQHGLARCLDCTFELAFVLRIPTPQSLNRSWTWYDWDAQTPLPGGAEGRMSYVHSEVAAFQSDLAVLVTYAAATTKESLSHSAAVWAVVIWMCAIVFVIGVLLLSKRPSEWDSSHYGEDEARLKLAEEQLREARQRKLDAEMRTDSTNPFTDANVVGIQDGGSLPPAIVNPDPDPDPVPEVDLASARAASEMRKRYVNAMNPSGGLSARLV